MLARVGDVERRTALTQRKDSQGQPELVKWSTATHGEVVRDFFLRCCCWRDFYT